ncbi:MAG: SIMPL domain-containing protein [Chloroflexi bacterium]|nr:SIMPL domain-containing protein [Chloroflexota bacterium]
MKNAKTLALSTLALVTLLGMVALVMSVGPFAAQASSAQQTADSPMNIITVSGIGTAYGAPDVAYVGVGADFTSANAAEAFAQTSGTMSAVRDALLTLGIEASDLQTTNVSIYPQDNYGPTGEITGRMYRVSSAMQVTVRDVAQIEAVISASIAAGANNLYNLSFGIGDPAALEQQARELAVANARARADQLAGLTGVTVGEPIVIIETLLGGGVPLPAAYNAARDGLGGAGVPVDTGRMAVTVQVQITYRIA